MATSKHVTSLSALHLRPLAACLVTAGALSSPTAQAIVITVPVLNCSDHDPNSLRDAVGSYPDGYVVDMTALACSTISLTTGKIVVSHNVTLAGPTDHTLTITSNDTDRVFVHSGTGMLTLDHLTITHGTSPVPALHSGGGCIYSYGSVTLQHSTVANCTMQIASANIIRGGGIYAMADLTLTNSVISGNQLVNTTATAWGGGAFAKHNFTANLSTVRDNLALGETSPEGSPNFGGGIFADGISQVYGTTFSGNQADHGGAFAALGSATFSNSTVSGNYAHTSGGGIYTFTSVTLNNTTIAFNTQRAQTIGGGVDCRNSLVMSSSIIAHNTSTLTGGDYSLYCRNGCSIGGSYNLITGANNGEPAGTSMLDPRLAPLADNGGPTRTHALKFGSPAIDTGSNIHDYPFDQRGTGHARGIGANPDIGAFELNTVDLIFSDGFD